MKWICHPSLFSQEPWKAGPGYSPLPSPPTPQPSLSWAAWKLTPSPRIPCALASGWDHPKGCTGRRSKGRRREKLGASSLFPPELRTSSPAGIYPSPAAAPARGPSTKTPAFKRLQTPDFFMSQLLQPTEGDSPPLLLDCGCLHTPRFFP